MSDAGAPARADADTGWAVQVVVHLPRPGAPEGEPPGRGDLLEAVAMAVGRLVDACYADDADPDWARAMRTYESGWIRKVVRRARGVAWRRVQEVPGIGVEHAGARVRALVPGPADALPDEVRKLQVGGTEVAESDEPDQTPRHPSGIVIAVNPLVEMTAGKAAAQVGHAAQLGWHAMPSGRRRTWAASGFAARLEPVDAAGWPAALGRAAALVRDGGLTEVAPGTTTAVAWW